jgi:ABC-type amino acid transport substrate-binding protein
VTVVIAAGRAGKAAVLAIPFEEDNIKTADLPVRFFEKSLGYYDIFSMYIDNFTKLSIYKISKVIVCYNLRMTMKSYRVRFMKRIERMEESNSRFRLPRRRALTAIICLSLFIAPGFFPPFEETSAAQSQERPAVSSNVIAVIPSDAPPTYFRDKVTGKPDGFAVEIMDIIAARSGLHVNYIFGDGWDDIINNIETGKADLAPEMAISEDRKKKLAFTTPLSTVSVSFIVRASFDLINWKPEGHTVGVIKQSVVVEHLRNTPDIRLVTYQGFSEGLFDLLAGKIDAFACPDAILVRLANEARVDDKIRVIAPPITEIKRAIAIRKDNTVLLERLNKGLEGFVGSPDYQRIYTKWYGKPIQYWTPRRIFIIVIPIFSIVSIIAGMYIWRYLSVLRLNQELQKAFDTIKTLQGILPICASCKKIRDDKGYWNQLEDYISQHSEAEFSHGICPECAKKIYPEYFEDK